MAMKPREKQLALITGILLALVVGRFLYSTWEGPIASLRSRRANLLLEIERKNNQVRKGKEAETRLKELGRRSLPTDLTSARSAYQTWLLTVANDAGLQGTKVVAGQGRQRGDV
jgi:hypothetical protein